MTVILANLAKAGKQRESAEHLPDRPLHMGLIVLRAAVYNSIKLQVSPAAPFKQYLRWLATVALTRSRSARRRCMC